MEDFLIDRRDYTISRTQKASTVTQKAAIILFIAVMATAIVAWAWALVKALKLGVVAGRSDVDFDDAPSLATETGNVTIQGEPETVSKSLAKSLRQSNLGAFGTTFRLTQKSHERLAFEKLGPLICNQPTGLYFSEVEFDLAPADNGTVRVSYEIGYAKLVSLPRKISLIIVLAVGLPVILIVGIITWFFVIQSNAPSVRWQVFQSLQVVHGLWPPYVLFWIYKLGRRHSKYFVENLISSVEIT